MEEYIRKSAVIAEIERLEKINQEYKKTWKWKFKWFYRRIIGRLEVLAGLKNFLNTLEVKDPYEQRIQYDSIRAGIQAYAETYSFCIQSELFNQLTKEQQFLWNKEIKQAVINGGNAGVELAEDIRYDKNIKKKKMDLDYIEKELAELIKVNKKSNWDFGWGTLYNVATYFYELGLKAA